MKNLPLSILLSVAIILNSTSLILIGIRHGIEQQKLTEKIKCLEMDMVYVGDGFCQRKTNGFIKTD